MACGRPWIPQVSPNKGCSSLSDVAETKPVAHAIYLIRSGRVFVLRFTTSFGALDELEEDFRGQRPQQISEHLLFFILKSS